MAYARDLLCYRVAYPADAGFMGTRMRRIEADLMLGVQLFSWKKRQAE